MGCDYYIQTDLVIVYYDNNNALSSTKTNKFLVIVAVLQKIGCVDQIMKSEISKYRATLDISRD